jgi:hypothetical protein
MLSREEAVYCRLQTHNHGPWECTHLRRRLRRGVHWLLDLLYLPASMVDLLGVDGGGPGEAHGWGFNTLTIPSLN